MHYDIGGGRRTEQREREDEEQRVTGRQGKGWRDDDVLWEGGRRVRGVAGNTVGEMKE